MGVLLNKKNFIKVLLLKNGHDCTDKEIDDFNKEHPNFIEENYPEHIVSGKDKAVMINCITVK